GIRALPPTPPGRAPSTTRRLPMRWSRVAPLLLALLPVSARAQVRLNGPLALGPRSGSVQTDLAYTPSGESIVYRPDVLHDRAFQLFSVPVSGSRAARCLSGPTGIVSRFRVSPDGTRVAYVSDAERASAFGLHVTPVEGGARRRLHAPGDPGSVVLDL